MINVRFKEEDFNTYEDVIFWNRIVVENISRIYLLAFYTV